MIYLDFMIPVPRELQRDNTSYMDSVRYPVYQIRRDVINIDGLPYQDTWQEGEAQLREYIAAGELKPFCGTTMTYDELMAACDAAEKAQAH